MFWQDCPVDEYHFIFQIVPYKFYHGVEHKKSTVITIGPGYAINGGDVYEDVLGVSCHELFHLWNIKTIRPIEMLPYDYTKENYSRSGYVYEGFTTYYGDKILLSSDVFNEQQYFVTLQERLLKHFHNFGRFSLSVTDSSWETWLDGYLPGAPYRKTNIYDEGCLIAFMLDVLILKATGNTKSLRDVCLSGERLQNSFNDSTCKGSSVRTYKCWNS
jgi:predicted metalloprotease with PDZ domain